MKARTRSRLTAVQVLYQKAQNDSDISEILTQFLNARVGKDIEALPQTEDSEFDQGFFVKLCKGASSEHADLDEMIEANLSDDWHLDRLDIILKMILRCGLYEILHMPDVPAPVIINEYLEVTKSFFDDKEAHFVNKVLDAVAKVARTN